ncbi:MAG: class I SAM-dependent methyltransferase [Rhodospirillaceae bacterium]|jgi:NADH dehydrogenase [ubiquinone] 1 alpha subcomplex assembly factor 7|nr:class I SAM-dependent methyltransferase [Rhodospirillaceae bacterium]MBT5243560.1 class I SAM-dependent methyltransferase [Rhodospirillaceae bacterium]MBT5562148.1 class I SAM-dependent methyltransferase [Rhodospirillaceae bacterium]MBT6242321.1 class I SAM-dependent methyltransferase [Rhodospirillaceae bacterium]MBT7138973.1 class I SAM-dependent methyltransferase [Rhodospirillaceae bacterium]
MSLEEILIERIRGTGPLTIAEYMEQALAHPEYGYYMRGDPFGVSGDFVTAPEVSQMFGELLGLWAGVAWMTAGSATTINLVELGPGRGTLMADMLRAAPLVDGFSDAIEVHLVETSPALQEIQQQKLEGRDVVWHRAFTDVPEGPLIVIANEFFDALPIEQYFHAGDFWCPRMVDIKPDGDGLCFVLLPPFDTPELPPGLIDAPADVMVEVCPAALDISEDIARRIADHGGAALFVDYGHGQSAPGETLQAVKSHNFHDPLVDPGTADLTAHVDFGALAQRVFASGARALGPVTQGNFLTTLGIIERAETLRENATSEQAEDIARALQRLVDPEEMGDLFKVMAVTGLEAPPPPGFE